MTAATVSVLFGSAKKKGKKEAPEVAPPASGPMHMGMLPEESHEERLHRAAADEHVNAARDFVAGRISHKEFKDRKERAASLMKHTPKSTK